MSDSFWGDEPDEELEAFIDQVPVGRALDLGMGDGHNALWLAARGFEVVGVDRSPEAVALARQRARQRNLRIETHVADIRTFPIEPRSYTLILASAVLHFLLPEEARALACRICEGLCPGGVVMASVFTVDDPSYEALQERRTECLAPNTYYVPELDGPMHYFAPGELRELFQGLELLYYAEERHLDTTHDVPHYHSGAFLVARRLASS
jgi:SAM-dependent methyltransferase